MESLISKDLISKFCKKYKENSTLYEIRMHGECDWSNEEDVYNEYIKDAFKEISLEEIKDILVEAIKRFKLLKENDLLTDGIALSNVDYTLSKLFENEEWIKKCVICTDGSFAIPKLIIRYDGVIINTIGGLVLDDMIEKCNNIDVILNELFENNNVALIITIPTIKEFLEFS